MKIIFLFCWPLFFLNSCCAFALSDLPDIPADSKWIKHCVQPQQSLWNKQITKIIIEVDRVGDSRPHSTSLKKLKKTLLKHLRHIKEVNFVCNENIRLQEYKKHMVDGIFLYKNFCATHQNVKPRKNEYLIYLLALPHFSNDYAGIYHNLDNQRALICLDKNNIKAYAFLHISEQECESRVLQHELGHALGLCHNPTHGLSIGGGHCVNPWCLMYPKKFNFRFILCHLGPALLGSVEKDFCAQCLEDLKRYARPRAHNENG